MSNLSSNTMLLKLSPITRHTAFSAFLMPTVLKPRPQHKLDITAQARRGLSELLSMNNDKDKQSIHGRQPLKPGEVSPRRDVPPHIPRPPYADSGKMPDWDMNPQTHNAEGLSKMREACTLAARVLKYAGTLVKPGITTDEIDRAVHEMIIDAGAYPSPLNYGNFPKSVCTSVNECICHGIPDSRQLQEGDIVNIDVTVYLNGYHGDTSRMFPVGKIPDNAARLIKATEESLAAGIKACGPGVRFNAIGDAIQRVSDSYKYTLCKTFVGHGVGTVFHSYPHIMHHRNNSPGSMVPGMTFTIEPMLCEGIGREKFWNDGWTAVTVDGRLSAQQEHTLLITEKGVEILTLAD